MVQVMFVRATQPEMECRASKMERPSRFAAARCCRPNPAKAYVIRVIVDVDRHPND